MSREALVSVARSIDEVKQVITTLTDEEWARPSGCTDWSVRDLVAHMSSNYKETVEPSPPPPEPLNLPAERLMDLLVDLRDGVEQRADPRRIPAVLRRRARHAHGAAGRAVGVDGHSTRRPRELPDASAGRRLRVRPLLPSARRPAQPARADRTRAAAGRRRTGGAGGRLDARRHPTDAAGTRGEPHRAHSPRAHRSPAAGSGTSKAKATTSSWTRAQGDPDVTVTSDADAFVLWGTARTSWRDACTVDGDQQVAATFLDALNIV